MKFKYIGPHDAVDLVGVGTVAHGAEVEVSGAAAKSLDAQADWQSVKTAIRGERGPEAVVPQTKTPAKSATKNTEE